MRESNFAFPVQNRACVCISSQLYDRRALDTTSPLPLFNSLTHLTYLTSTSPRIREIMTVDGGLERLVHLLLDFTRSPPPPTNPALIYGLGPSSVLAAPRPPVLNPASYDKHAAYRFSLAFQCVVNIGVRGSEPIRQRVVQAGTLDVVGRILEAWLSAKGFAVGPGLGPGGRETRGQRAARRALQVELRQREQAVQAAAIARALQRDMGAMTFVGGQRVYPTRAIVQEPSSESNSPMDAEAASSPGGNDDAPSSGVSSAATSDAETPGGSSTPTGSVEVATRDRSGTIIARPTWDQQATNVPAAHARTASRSSTIRVRPHPHRLRDRAGGPSNHTAESTDTSRAETETEDDGDDVEMSDTSRAQSDAEPDPSPRGESPEPLVTGRTQQQAPAQLRRAVGIVSDAGGGAAPQIQEMNLNLDSDVHILINPTNLRGVEDGIVSLEPNDDFALGAPPGAPGAIDIAREANSRAQTPDVFSEPESADGSARVAGTDATPRAGTVALPGDTPTGRGQAGLTVVTPVPRPASAVSSPVESTPIARPQTAEARAESRGAMPPPPTIPVHAQTTTTVPTIAAPAPTTNVAATPTQTRAAAAATPRQAHHHHHHDAGPYRDEDVLLSLQLLAYLSKYPHVRQAFYKPRVAFHPATAAQGQVAKGLAPREGFAAPAREVGGFFKAFAPIKAKGKAAAPTAGPSGTGFGPPVFASAAPVPPPRQTNVFALVERFTFRPSSAEAEGPHPPPQLPAEIQYWAGVIMRNACRKDESRGGIRQCANMLCGRWESYPREFAKCRRCRKAKYCGKDCQSTAWSEGHRFWCSAKDGDDEGAHANAAEGAATPGARRPQGLAEARRERAMMQQATAMLQAAGAGATVAFRAGANPNAMLGEWPRRGEERENMDPNGEGRRQEGMDVEEEGAGARRPIVRRAPEDTVAVVGADGRVAEMMVAGVDAMELD